MAAPWVMALRSNRVMGGSNRVMSGSNRVMGGSNRVMSGANRVMSGSDRVMGGSDRVMSGSDRVVGGPSGTHRRRAFANVVVPCDSPDQEGTRRGYKWERFGASPGARQDGELGDP